MAAEIDLKKLEQKAFTSYFRDGLWDIYGGLIMLGFGLSMLTGLTVLMIALATLAVILLLFRKRLVIPRMGSVTFSRERVARTKRSKAIAMAVLFFTFLLGLFLFIIFSLDQVPGWMRAWIGDYFLVSFGGMLALMAGTAAYMVGVNRYYAHAALILLAFALANWLDVNPGLPITIAGAVILLVGLAIFIRFMRKYPLPAEEANGQP
jgi:hypothetical protein